MEKENLSIAVQKKRIFDQMASMHFMLSDKYHLKSIIEDVIEILLSVFLCGITFLDGTKYFNIQPTVYTLSVGFVSISLFAITLIKPILNHKQLSEQHRISGKMYANAKIQLSNQISVWGENTTEAEVIKYLNDHFYSLNDLPQIPEKNFAPLKHAHQTKVAFSKFLDSHPKDYYIICKIKFRFSSKQPDKSAQNDEKKENVSVTQK